MIASQFGTVAYTKHYISFVVQKKYIKKAGHSQSETSYHHGESSMEGTIIGLAQDYVGSNNVNLLRPEGMFGTRIQGGKDCGRMYFSIK